MRPGLLLRLRMAPPLRMVPAPRLGTAPSLGMALNPRELDLRISLLTLSEWVLFMGEIWFGRGIKSLKSKDLSPPVAFIKPKVCLGQFI